jgi:flagellar hook-length control protein FliK
VLSVTSEPTSLSFQGPPPPRRAPSPGNDSFAALVDNSAPADTSADRAQNHATAQRRSDDAAADDRRSRNSAAADRAAGNASDDRAAAGQRGNADVSDDAVEQSKSDSSKNAAAKSSDKPASDDTPATKSSADRDEPAHIDAPATTTPDAVAAPIAVAVAIAPTNTPAAPASGKGTAPLAIAAAAIAASAATAGDTPAATPAQAQIDSDAAAATTATTPNVAAKIDTRGAASEALTASVTTPTTQTEATAATNGAVAVAATAPVAPKAAHLKAAVATQTATAASDDSDAAPGTAGPSAPAVATGIPANGVAQPTAAAGKAKTGNGIVDATKADASPDGSPASSANTSAHGHSTQPAAQPLPDASDTAGIQAAGTIQPQLHTAATSAAHASTLTATAATSDAVPLSGLAMEIAVTARSGKSRFEIRLDPADLGRIDVRIDVDRNGHVTSHLTVEKAETLSMLRQDAPQLQRALDDAGFKTGGGGLQFSLRDQSSSGQNNDSGSGRNAHRLIVSEDDTIPAAVAGRTYGRMLGSSSGVDIKV